MEAFNVGKGDDKDATEGHPFISLGESDIGGNNSRFYKAEGKDDVVVRKSYVNIKGEEAKDMDIHEKAEWLRNKTEAFKKIVQKANIQMANTDFVIGRTPGGEPSIFAVTERIDGKNLREIEHLDEETAKEADALFARIISGMIDSFLNNEYFWYDPSSAQFVLGKAKDDTVPKIYLVDVDPNVWKWDDPVHKMEKTALFSFRINSVLYYIEDMEKKVEIPNFKFEKSREMIESSKQKIPGRL